MPDARGLGFGEARGIWGWGDWGEGGNQRFGERFAGWRAIGRELRQASVDDRGEGRSRNQTRRFILHGHLQAISPGASVQRLDGQQGIPGHHNFAYRMGV